MNNTFKVGYNSQTGKPVCKIILKEVTPIIKVKSTNPLEQPDTIVWHDDEDERDKMVREFLHNPLYTEPYEYYQKGCRLPINDDKVLVTIEPIQEENLLYKFRHSLLNRYIPYDTLVEINRRTTDITDGPETSLQTRKYLTGEDLAHKINEFFNWLEVDCKYATHEQRHPYNSQF